MILKTITVSDIHGKDCWKDINPDKYDKIIFIGDYMDAPYRNINDVKPGDALNDRVLVNAKTGKTHGELLYNLSEIIRFKDEYPDKVVLLVGNHDIPYVLKIRNESLYLHTICSGHRYTMAIDAAKLFNDNFKKFDLMFQLGNVLWSHAGLTQEAYNSYFKSLINDRFDILVEEMNKQFILNNLDLHIIPELRGGFNKYGSVTWADRREWNAETYKLPFIQIVGHTPVKDILYLYADGELTNDVLDKVPVVIFTDVLEKHITFFEYDVEI